MELAQSQPLGFVFFPLRSREKYRVVLTVAVLSERRFE
jgi:hypothetical protein